MNPKDTQLRLTILQQKTKIYKDLEKLIKGALFLEDEPHRKDRWLDTINQLSLKDAEQLKEAIIKENLIYTKNQNQSVVFDDLFNESELFLIKEPDAEESLENALIVGFFAVNDIYEREGIQIKKKLLKDPLIALSSNKNQEKALNIIKNKLDDLEMQEMWGDILDRSMEIFMRIKDVK